MILVILDLCNGDERGAICTSFWNRRLVDVDVVTNFI